MKTTLLRFVATLAVATTIAASASAQTQIEVTVTTTGPVGLAPAFASFHDGSYDIFDVGGSATAGLELLAEVGDASSILTEAAATNAAAFAPGGPFAPNGGTGSHQFTVDVSDDFFSIAAMVLPSNDWFIGTGSALDISSLHVAPMGTSLNFMLSNVYDAGTEAEDFAFAPGGGLVGITTASSPGDGTATSDLISLVDIADPFSGFLNIEPASFDTSSIDFNGSPIATISLKVVPEPASALMACFGFIGVLGFRRGRNS